MLVPHHRPNLCWKYCFSNFTLLRTQPSLVLRIISTPATQESTSVGLCYYHFTFVKCNCGSLKINKTLCPTQESGSAQNKILYMAAPCDDIRGQTIKFANSSR
jgi:hypothetical protein